MTELTDFQRKITAFLPEIEMKTNEPMSKHTSFRIGGPAEVMAFPKTEEELSTLLQAAAQLQVAPRILGAGTNVLAPDEGLPGLVICLKDCLTGLQQVGETVIRAYAGVSMAKTANFAASLGLSGLEFAHGIPGSIGGGVYMNAGAYGGEICQVCESVEIMINGTEAIFIEREGSLQKLDVGFESAEKLQDVIQQIVAGCNRVVNEASPIVDARLKNGARVNIVMNPVALNGPIVTIRRFPDHPITMDKLIQNGSIILFDSISDETSERKQRL